MSHKPKLFDTHTHAYYPPLSDMADEVVEKMRTNNVMKAVQIGTNVEHSREAIDLAKRFPGEYYATVGLHPTDAQDIDFESDLGIQTRNELTQLIGENN